MRFHKPSGVATAVETSPRQALVFAAGPGQRLLPLTESRPKGMLLVGGKPLLQHAVEALRAVGVAKVIVVVGHHGDKIQAFLKDGRDFGVAVEYVHQDRPIGTLDAMRLAMGHLDSKQPAFVLPGHVYVDADMLRPLSKQTITTMLLATAGDAHVQGVPTVRGDRLRGMRHEQPVQGSTRVATNILVAQPALLAAVGANQLQGTELDLALGEWSAQGNDVGTLHLEGPWLPVVSPWDLLRLNEWVLEHTLGREVRVGKDSHIAPSAVLVGPVTIGDGCTVAEHSVVGPFVSVRNCTAIGAHVEVRRSIINNNVILDSQSLVRSSILDDGCLVGAGFIATEALDGKTARGCIIGRDSVIPLRSTLGGGAIVPVESGREA